MEEKWEFVTMSEEDFCKKSERTEGESLFSAEEFTFQNIGKTPDLFRTTEFDNQNATRPENQQNTVISPPHNLSSHSDNLNIYENNQPRTIQRTYSMPRSLERQVYTIPLQYNSHTFMDYSINTPDEIIHAYDTHLSQSQTQSYYNNSGNFGPNYQNHNTPNMYSTPVQQFSSQMQSPQFESQLKSRDSGPPVLRRSTDPTYNNFNKQNFHNYFP